MVATAILAYLLLTIPIADFGAALARVSLWRLVALALGFTLALLFADSLTMWIGFREAIPGSRLALVPIMVIRGASYLLAIVNYGAGQGGIIYFLKRYHGIRLAAAAGAVLLTTGAFVMVIALFVGVGMLAGAVPNRPELRLLAAGVVASVPVYFVIVAIRPRFLNRWSLLTPLFDAGVGGTARVAAARVLHAAILVMGHWLALRLFGVEVPFFAALARLPVLFLVASLPIAPSGLGTTQAAAITMFAEFAPGATVAARQASVLAYSLSLHFVATGIVALLGLYCLRRLTASPPPTNFDNSQSAS